MHKVLLNDNGTQCTAPSGLPSKSFQHGHPLAQALTEMHPTPEQQIHINFAHKHMHVYGEESLKQANCQPSCSNIWLYSMGLFKEGKVGSELGQSLLCQEWRYQPKKPIQTLPKSGVGFSAPGIQHLLAHHPK